MNTPLTVFFIDDDLIFQFAAKKTIHLLSPDIKVLTFSNGQEALDFLFHCDEKFLPQVIFLDIQMPVKNGWEFLDGLHGLDKRICEKISIYLLSSSLSEGDWDKSKKYDLVKEFIIKPLSSETLKRILTLVPGYAASSENAQ